MDAFVDESIRGQTYFLCAVIVPFENQSLLRQELRQIARFTGRRRLHFNNATSEARAAALKRVRGATKMCIIVNTQMVRGMTDEMARQAALASLVARLQRLGVERLTIESRGDDRIDSETILRVRANGPNLDFVHLKPEQDELLWAADAVVWAFGAGVRWSNQLSKLPIQIIKGSI